MAPFRGSDDSLDAEIATLEEIVKVRVRRTARELRDLDRERRELVRERARRRAEAETPVATDPIPETESA